jgi:hypothetical protein
MSYFPLVYIPAYFSLFEVQNHGDDGAISDPKFAIDGHAFSLIIDVPPECDPHELITINGCAMLDTPGADANHDIGIFLSESQL